MALATAGLSLAALLFLLLAAHAAADFPLQGDAVAVGKSRHALNGAHLGVPWVYWLSAHALSHGLAVTLVTGSPVLGALETGAHWLIDFGKCERRYSIHVDQALHVACKVAWAILSVYGVR